MKKWSLLLLTLVLTVLVAACGNNNTKNQAAGANQGSAGNAANEQPAEQNLLEAVKASGKLRIGTEGTYAPFTFHDKDGKLTGFDVEIAEEVAKRLGVEAEFIETPWDGIFAGLDAKRFDAVFNEVTIRDDRKEKYDFSDPYIVSRAVLIVPEDNEDIKTFADLKGKKAGQSLTSNLTDIARENGAEIVATEGFNQAIDLLLSKRIDATVNDGLSFLDLKKQRPDVKLKVVDEMPEASESAALFNKGNEELVQAVNEALAAMKSDGTYLKISEKYFGEDVSK
ncbi:amino acid ABC transporter substrate-binding protein [Paenibacillus sp. MB22_1]|uniref:amino acid ABC transporter substrate-binding protein n=1 Tax=Paenibacillus TaxID=44249 RepID=UPI0001AFCE7C|nr:MULTISPECIES: amino acid ABC transporter substrate-binding protein [unclassified Paenibacillus]EES74675.1 cystine-binding periplasmic protein [Paenibacillus sp. oral taxon 786 str. D14]MCT2195728.1 amino acid ABC transporter substrate-binding protein [Paenibacillus sp. p3-SID1389]